MRTSLVLTSVTIIIIFEDYRHYSAYSTNKNPSFNIHEEQISRRFFVESQEKTTPVSPPRGGGDTGVVEQQCKKLFDIDIFIRLHNISSLVCLLTKQFAFFS